MLIESYLVEFSKIKKCITSMDSEDFVVMSKSIFFWTLQLTFASTDSIHDLLAVSVKKNIDGVAIRSVRLEALLLAQQIQQKRYRDNQAIFKKSIAIYRKDMALF